MYMECSLQCTLLPIDRSPMLGRWSDIYGRKKILLISNVETFFGWLLFLFALLLPISTLFDVNFSLIGTFVITLSLLMLFVARATDGITGGNVSIANAYLADVSSNEDRSKNFTLKESKRLSSQMQIFERGTVRKVFAHECKDCFDSRGIIR